MVYDKTLNNTSQKIFVHILSKTSIQFVSTTIWYTLHSKLATLEAWLDLNTNTITCCWLQSRKSMLIGRRTACSVHYCIKNSINSKETYFQLPCWNKKIKVSEAKQSKRCARGPSSYGMHALQLWLVGHMPMQGMWELRLARIRRCMRSGVEERLTHCTITVLIWNTSWPEGTSFWTSSAATTQQPPGSQAKLYHVRRIGTPNAFTILWLTMGVLASHGVW